jgi:hypothetical protein
MAIEGFCIKGEFSFLVSQGALFFILTRKYDLYADIGLCLVVSGCKLKTKYLTNIALTHI